MTRTKIGTATVTDGTATTNYTIPSILTTGEHTLYAIFEETDTHETGTGYNTLMIRYGTSTTINNAIASIGETITLTANVTATDNSTINEGTIQFMVGNSNVGSPVNVSNGTATYNYTVPSNTSDGTIIKAIYIATDNYATSTSSDGVLSIREDVTVTVNNISANREGTATITATVTDTNDDPVTSGNAQLYIDNVSVGSLVNVDNNGELEFSYSIPNDASYGSHTIKVTYQQNDRYNSEDGTGTLTVRTPVTLTPVNVSANKGGTCTVTIQVKDNNNTAVTSGTVNITVGNSSPVACTVVSGEASTTYNVPADASGTISFSASYAQNDNYQSSNTSTNGIITIRKEVTLEVSTANAIVGETITLSSKLTDEDDDPVTSGTVEYEID